MLGSNYISPCLVKSNRFLFFNNKSLTALKPHSVRYEDGKGNKNFYVKMVECGNLVSVSSQSHDITLFHKNDSTKVRVNQYIFQFNY